MHKPETKIEKEMKMISRLGWLMDIVKHAILSDSLCSLFPKYETNNMTFSFKLGIKMRIRFNINLHSRTLLQ
jgi:hypothetical protein